MSKCRWNQLSLAGLVIFFGACSKDTTPTSAGPIDGSYVIQAWTCGSTNVYSFLTTNGGTVTSITFSVAATSGSTVVTYANSCTRTQPFTGSYSGGAITENSTTPLCPNGCSTYCSGFTSSTDTYSYLLSGQTLTLTRNLSSANVSGNQAIQAAGCTTGQTEIQTWASNSTSVKSTAKR